MNFKDAIKSGNLLSIKENIKNQIWNMDCFFVWGHLAAKYNQYDFAEFFINYSGNIIV